MATLSKRKRLLDAYRFVGFRPIEWMQGVFGDPRARVITLVRRSKKQLAVPAVEYTAAGTIAHNDVCAICPVEPIGSIWSSKFGECFAETAKR